MVMAVEPILASSLWDFTETASTKQRLNTACNNIDAALKGGFDYGCITCISAEPDSGAKDVTQALLLSHLLGSKMASATVIDTGQAVDVRRLYQTILSASPDSGDKTAAKSMLDKVKIMKLFDFEGLTEAMGELRDALEGSALLYEKPPRGTVADSQADENEMLDSDTPATANQSAEVRVTTATAESEAIPDATGLLIIDNITQLAAPLLKTNHASGQALIASFMRSLAHLAKRHNLCTVILNSVLSYPIKGGFDYSQKEESPSAFASCAARPALGKSWTYLVDVHLLMHRMPKTEKGARAMRDGQRIEGTVEMVSVLEVIQDRCDGRVGRWAACSMDDKGGLRGVL